MVVDGPELEPLPNDALVVRGGLMASDVLWTNAQDHRLERLEEGLPEEWAISVYSMPGSTAAEIARAAGPRLLHSKIRVSTVGAIRAIGGDVVPTDAVHADLKLPGQPDEPMWEMLRSVFSDPEPNPGREVDND